MSVTSKIDIRVFRASAILGYGCSLASLEAGCATSAVRPPQTRASPPTLCIALNPMSRLQAPLLCAAHPFESRGDDTGR